VTISYISILSRIIFPFTLRLCCFSGRDFHDIFRIDMRTDLDAIQNQNIVRHKLIYSNHMGCLHWRQNINVRASDYILHQKRTCCFNLMITSLFINMTISLIYDFVQISYKICSGCIALVLSLRWYITLILWYCDILLLWYCDIVIGFRACLHRF